MAATCYWLGDWLVEPELNRLRQGHDERHLEPRSMDVLTYLLEHAGELVSPDRLLDEVWAGRIVEPTSVHRGINQIRHALGDDPRAPRYIETIRKRGYRIVAPVERCRANHVERNRASRAAAMLWNAPALVAASALLAVTLMLTLAPVDWRSAKSVPGETWNDQQAYALYKQARHLMNTSMEPIDLPKLLLERAADSEPESAALHLELARANWRDKSGDPRSYWSRVENTLAHLEYTIGRNAHVYAWRGWIAYDRDYNLPSAAMYFSRAVELESHDVDILRPLVVVLLELNQVEEAVAIGRYLAVEDPICAICLIQHAQALFMAGKLEDAVDAASRARLLAPHWPIPREVAAYLWMQRGNAKRALELVEPITPQHAGRRWVRSLALYDLNDPAFRAEFDSFIRTSGRSDPARIAHIYSHIGDLDEAFAWLQQVGHEHEFLIAGFDDTHWKNLTDDLRWRRFQSRLGIAPDQLEGHRVDIYQPLAPFVADSHAGLEPL